MPYKNKEKQKKAMRRIMRKHRAKKKQQKKQARNELLHVFPESEIKVKLPTVHELVFGESKRKKKEKGR